MIPLNTSTGIPLRYANRHGLISGPTGTGKTVTLQTLIEGFSHAGVPVMVADVKGDISAIARTCPTHFVDLFGNQGDQISTTVEAMGADALARAFGLSDAQSGALEVLFAVARSFNVPLHTLDDLRKLIATVMQIRGQISAEYGQVSASSLGVIQRSILRIQAQGGAAFFGQSPYDVAALMSEPGKVTILAADQLIQSPRVYAAFLLHMLESLYNRLPEIGDQAAPRLVFFFDEAHLLFNDAPPALLAKVEQTARLIRSKGVGVYFVTQAPEDVPHLIREQLAHKVTHSRTLGVGVADVETMTRDGKPTAKKAARIQLPRHKLGPLDEAERETHGKRPSAKPDAALTASKVETSSVADTILTLGGFGIIGLLVYWGLKLLA